MWNRADLKANAKKIFFGNYWKAVLVTLILTIILGGATNTITRRISNNINLTGYRNSSGSQTAIYIARFKSKL